MSERTALPLEAEDYLTWLAMETLISCVGMAGVMILSVIV